MAIDDTILDVTDRPVRAPRAESREVVELKGIKAAHPELASAVDMQLELVEVQRRVKARVPLPWIQHETPWLEAQVRSGRSAVRFGDIPLEWSDFRLSLRQTADILYRHETIDRAEHEQILALSRDGNALAPLVKQWDFATSHSDRSHPDELAPPGSPACRARVPLLALRPFVARCAEALLPGPEFSAWHPRHGPI